MSVLQAKKNISYAVDSDSDSDDEDAFKPTRKTRPTKQRETSVGSDDGVFVGDGVSDNDVVEEEPIEMDSDEDMPTVSTVQQWSFDPTAVRPLVNWAQGNEYHHIHSRNLADPVKGVRRNTFRKGQTYVALSRATCQEGLQVSRFDPKKIMAHEKVRTFYDSLDSVKKKLPI
ncbi:hypothetical protein BDR22DRAFT_817600 [Usnea florida]